MANREIKFRAWEGGKMHYDLSYITMTGGAMGVDRPLINPVLMQYIGVDDCHGQMIYEGDVYKAEGMLPTTVVFKDGVFRGDGGSDEGVAYDNEWYAGTIEVIGNIYEHPELTEP